MEQFAHGIHNPLPVLEPQRPVLAPLQLSMAQPLTAAPQHLSLPAATPQLQPLTPQHGSSHVVSPAQSAGQLPPTNGTVPNSGVTGGEPAHVTTDMILSRIQKRTAATAKGDDAVTPRAMKAMKAEAKSTSAEKR